MGKSIKIITCGVRKIAWLRHVIFSLGTLSIIGLANANPILNNIASGNVSVVQSSTTTQINQTSQQGIINWHSFNIGPNEKTHFQQPVGGITLNRIDPNQGASQIFGMLTATGKIILVNQAGIFFGPGSVVNVGGIIASTSGISDKNFLAGNYIFDQPSPYAGSIVNQGKIIAEKNGLVALVGTAVSNQGLIKANLGEVVLASGNKFTVDLSGDQLVNFTIDEGTTSAGVSPIDGSQLKNAVNNSGKIIANGGTILMTAQAASSVLDNVINMSGVAVAHSVSEQNGEIILAGGNTGVVNVTGKIDASGQTAHTTGGTVVITGHNVLLNSSAQVNVSGDVGGGEILIGGNPQGKTPLSIFNGNQVLTNAAAVDVLSGASLSADAITTGNGGRVVVWSDQATNFYGSISAQGGASSGNGGNVETSGEYLNVNGAIVNTLAAHGQTGNWLLDPSSLTISTGSNSNVSGSSPFSPFANTGDSVLNTTTLQNALATSSITVETTNNGAGGSGGDITVANNVTWAAATTLTLTAYRDITINSGVTVSNSNASSGLVLEANNTGAFSVYTAIGTLNNSYHGIVANNGTISVNGGLTVFTNPTETSGNQNYATQPSYTNTSGSSTNYMLVSNVFDLQEVSTNLAGNYALSTNIDASATSGWNAGAGFNPIGTYTGKFNGQGFAISNLTINRAATNAVGLFSIETGTISNLGLINPSISGNATVGALAGSAAGVIMNDYTTGGSVTGHANNIGGLIGSSGNNLSIQDSYASTNVSTSGVSGGAVGGFIGIFGTNSSGTYSISNIYATGSVSNTSSTSNQTIGGLIGQICGGGCPSFNVSNVYSTGSVSVSTSSVYEGALVGYNGGGTWTNGYWDKTTSGLSNAAGNNFPLTSGVTGYTTAQLQAGLPSGFSTSIWAIIPAQGATTYTYPFLQALTQGVSGLVENSSNVAQSGVSVSIAEAGANLSGSVIQSSLTTSDSNGVYYYLLNKSFSSNTTPILLYTSSDTGNTVIISSGDTYSPAASYNIVQNNLNVYAPNASVSLGNIATAVGSLSTNILFTASGNDITLNNGVNFSAPISTTTVNLNGNLTTSGSGTISFAGPVLLSADSTLTTANAGITFNSTVNGASALTIAASSGSVVFDGAVGGSTALSALTINTGDATTLQNVTTSGAQSYSSTVTLGANTVLTGGAISLAAVVGGGNNLTIDNSAASSISGIFSGSSSSLIMGGSDTLTLSAINSYGGTTTVNAGILEVANNSALSSGAVVVNSGGTLQIDFTYAPTNALTITGTGSAGQGALAALGRGTSTYGGNITVNGAATIGSGAGNTFDVNGTLNDAVANTDALTLTGSGTINLSGSVGNLASLASITSTSATTLGINTQSIQTSGAQTYNGVVKVGVANLMLTSTTGAGISFGSTVDGATTLTIANNSGAVSFGGAVGSNTTLTGLTVGTGDPTTLQSVTTFNPQTYNSAVTLGADATLTSVGDLGITFTSTVDGAYALSIADSSGTVSFDAAVGATTALTSLTVGALDLTTLQNVKTSGAQTYNSAVTLGANTTLTSTGGGGISFASTVDGANTLAIANNSGTILFSGAVGSVAALTSLTVGTGDATTIQNVKTVNAQIYNSAVTLGADTTLTSTGGAGITFASTLDGAQQLTIDNSSGPISFEGAVGNNVALIDILVGTGDATTLQNVTTSNSQTYNSAATLGADTTLTVTGGNGIIFASTVDGLHALTIADNSGTISFGDAIGGSSALTSVTIGTGDFATVENVTTSGAQTYNDALSLGTNAVFTSTGSSGISFNSTVDDQIDGQEALTIANNSGAIHFAGAVGGGFAALHAITVGTGDATTLQNITTSGSQTYNSSVTLGGDAILTSIADNGIVFNSTVDGAHGLTIGDNSGTVSFGAAVGSHTQLTSLTVGVATATTLQNVSTTGAQTYHSAVTLGADTTLTSANGSGITFASTVDGAQALTIADNSGTVSFNNAVGSNMPLTQLILGVNDPTTLQNISTTNAQTYNSAVTLGADATLTSVNGSGITFASTVDGAQALTIADNSGAVLFAGTVGSNITLSSLTVGVGDPTTLSAVSTSNSQLYNSAVTLGADSTLTSVNASGITFGSTVDGAHALTIAGDDGSVTFDAAVGSHIALTSLTVGLNDATTLQNVSTSGDQVYNSTITLTQNTNLTLTNAGQININGLSAAGLTLTLSGGSSDTNFVLQGSLSVDTVNVQGGAGNNTLSLQTNDAQAWTIFSANTGSVNNLAGVLNFNFSSVANLVGGFGNSNTFNMNGAAQLVSIFGGTAAGSNTINYSAYQGAVVIQFSSQSAGNTFYNNTLVNGFSDFANVIANGSSTIQLKTSSPNSVVITGAGQGYINDPTNFTGFNTIIGHSGDQITFNTSYTSSSAGVTVNGVSMFFDGFTIPDTSTSSTDTTSTLTQSNLNAIIGANNSATSTSSSSSGNSNSTVDMMSDTFAAASFLVDQNISSLYTTQTDLDTQINQSMTVGCMK